MISKVHSNSEISQPGGTDDGQILLPTESLCSLCWLQTHAFPALASQVLGLQECTTMPVKCLVC
jgi:hypothetical protein